MTRVNVTATQKYNDIVMYFPTALLAGMMMDELIVATDGNISFKVEVEEVPVKGTEEKDTEEKEDDVDGVQTSES